jgi:phage tail sheath gpL-like
MRGNGLLQAQLFFLGTLASLALQHIARADEGHAQQRGRVASGIAQGDQLTRQVFLYRRNDGAAQISQQGAAFFQRGHRVVIAAQQDQPAVRIMQAHHQLVVQFPRITGRRAGVENVTGQQYRIHRLLLHLLQQPVDQRLMLGLAAAAHEMLAQMPVRSVKNAHAIALAGKQRILARAVASRAALVPPAQLAGACSGGFSSAGATAGAVTCGAAAAGFPPSKPATEGSG